MKDDNNVKLIFCETIGFSQFLTAARVVFIVHLFAREGISMVTLDQEGALVGQGSFNLFTLVRVLGSMKSDAVRLGSAYTNRFPSVVERDVALNVQFSFVKFRVAFTLQSNLLIIFSDCMCVVCVGVGWCMRVCGGCASGVGRVVGVHSLVHNYICTTDVQM